MLTDDRHVVPLTLLAQAGTSLCLAALLWLWQGSTAGASALLGGAAAVVPNGFLAARLLNARTASGMLRSAWLGEAGKVVLTVLAFGVIFGYVRPLSAPAVFGGFIAAQVAMLGALVFGGGNKQPMTKS